MGTARLTLMHQGVSHKAGFWCTDRYPTMLRKTVNSDDLDSFSQCRVNLGESIVRWHLLQNIWGWTSVTDVVTEDSWPYHSKKWLIKLFIFSELKYYFPADRLRVTRKISTIGFYLIRQQSFRTKTMWNVDSKWGVTVKLS